MNLESLIPTLSANLVWQTLLLALVVGLVLRILPKHAAQTRYRIALISLFGSGLLCAAPFLPDLTPDLSIGLTPQIATSAISQNPIPLAADPIQDIAVAPVEPVPAFSLGQIILGIWLAGTLIAFAKLGRAALTSLAWTRKARPVIIPQQNTLSKPIRLRQSADISTPLVLGFFRPVVLVPTDFDLSLENPGTRAVLEHEIAHLVRWDLWTNLAQHIILALLWWCVPLYWIHAQIGIEREKLCDDIAAQKIGTGRALANALVDLVDKHPKQQPLLAIGIHPRAHNLADRIHRLCKETPMPKLSKRLLLTTSIAIPALLGSLILAAPRAIAHPPSSSHNSDHMNMEDISSLQYGLFHAASTGRIDEVRALIGAGADPDFHIHGDGSPLIIAAKHGHVETARILLQHGAQINRMTGSDESALINAVRGNHYNMVEFLVSNGADVSLGQVSNPMRRPEWRSPLSTAQKYGHTKIAQYLQSQGAVADNRKQGGSPMIQKIVDGRLTSKFGTVRKKFDAKKHTGIDIANKSGTPIYAPANGVITEVTNTYRGKTSWGHVVVMESEGHVETVFAHLKDSQVTAGQTVTKGTQIARVGNTGKSTGPHVHIETSVRGDLADPLQVWPVLAR